MPVVAYDNQASITGSAVTSLTTGSFTISSNANRAAIVSLNTDAGSGMTYTVGGVAASGQIPGCFSTNVLTSVVTAPASGSQTASASWTGAANAVLGVLTFYNVNQTTPTNNGTVSGPIGAGTSASITITSTPGDMTVDHVFVNASTLSAPTQNLGYNTANALLVASGSTYGPGTGTTTHAWTLTAGNGGRSDGVNLVKVADNPVPSAMFVSP